MLVRLIWAMIFIHLFPAYVSQFCFVLKVSAELIIIIIIINNNLKRATLYRRILEKKPLNDDIVLTSLEGGGIPVSSYNLNRIVDT